MDCSSQRSPSPGPNHVVSSSSSVPNSASAPPNASSARPSCSFTPALAAHFNDNLIKHVQGWPAEHAEKQVCHCTFIYVDFIVHVMFFSDLSYLMQQQFKQMLFDLHIIKASRLREEAHTMGSICMSENCTELKNLRSLVRVCEIQATLREQRWEYMICIGSFRVNLSS